MRTFFSILGLAATIAVTGTAGATAPFPPAIKAKLGASAEPDCSVCHAGGRTGRGTVTTPFGTAMRARGVVAFDVPSLEAALDKMAADKVDSNGDGTIDVDELRAGKDPNAGAATATSDTPTYGCVGRVAPARGTTHGAVAALALIACAAWLRRRGARRH